MGIIERQIHRKEKYQEFKTRQRCLIKLFFHKIQIHIIMINVPIHTQILFLLNEESTQTINILKITQCHHFHISKMVIHKIILSTINKIPFCLHNNNLWDNYSYLITKIHLIILIMTIKSIF